MTPIFTAIVVSVLSGPPSVEMVLQNARPAGRGDVSSDENIIATFEDKKVLLWRRGKIIRRFAANSQSRNVDISPNDQWVASGNTVMRVDGTQSCAHADGGIGKVLFSPDSKWVLARAGELNKFVQFDTATCTQRATYTKHSSTVLDFAIDPRGEWVVSGDAFKTVLLWRLDESASSIKLVGHQAMLELAAFSPTGEHFATCETHGGCIIWQRDGTRKAAFKPSSEIRNELVFSSDGQTVWIAGSKVEGFDLNGKRAHSFSLPGGTRASMVRTHSDGQRLFVAADRVGLYSLAGKHQTDLTRSDSSQAWVTTVAFSPDGNELATGTFDNNETVTWTLSNGPRHVLRGETERANFGSTPVRSIAYHPSGTSVAIGSEDERIRLWDTHGNKLRDLTAPSNQVRRLAYSPDGKWLAAATAKYRGGAASAEIYLWNEAGERRVTLGQGIDGEISGLAFTPDGEQIVACYAYPDKKVRVWNRTGSLVRSWAITGSFSETACALSADGKLVAAGAASVVTLYDVTSGEVKAKLAGHTGELVGAAFSADGKWLATAARADSPSDPALIVWDVKQTKLHRVLKGHKAHVTDVAFNQAGKLASSSKDFTVKLWDVVSGENVSYVRHDNGWVMYTPDGLFDGSARGGDVVAMVSGSEGYAVDQFALKNNRPDLILERLGIGSKTEITHYREQYQKRLTRAGLRERDLRGELEVPQVSIVTSERQDAVSNIVAKCTSEKYLLQSYQVYVNDVPLSGLQGKTLSGKTAEIRYTVPLTTGKNRIEVSCTNQQGAESLRASTEEVLVNAQSRNLYYLGFGVSKYALPELALAYAAKDAQDLAQVFTRMKGKVFDEVHSRVYLDDQVDAKAIADAAEFIVKARPQDTLVVFIAGHGVHDQDKAQTYYYLTHGADPRRLSRTALPFEALESLLYAAPARHKLFLMDTCESGEASDDITPSSAPIAATLASRGIKRTSKTGKQAAPREHLLTRDRFIHNDLIRRSGAIVFSSSRGGELSYESSEIENGFFTEEILAALSGSRADTNRDGTVSVTELRIYVSSTVPKRTANLQHPVVDRDNLYVDFSFAPAQ